MELVEYIWLILALVVIVVGVRGLLSERVGRRDNYLNTMGLRKGNKY